jgi:DNA-binding protein
MEKSKNENVILIGGKPLMGYIKGIMYQFDKEGQDQITIKSRGKFISKAVDVAEVTRKKFLAEKGLVTKNVRIDSEEFETKEGKKITVSTIEIVLGK